MIVNFFKNKNLDTKKSKRNTIIYEDIVNVTALLLEASSIDGNIEDSEIDKIVELISKYFNLERNKFDDLYRDAALIQKESTSFHNLTSKIHKKYSYSQKIDILEMLWEVIMINRDIDDFESNLMRRISGLLHIKDVDSGLV